MSLLATSDTPKSRWAHFCAKIVVALVAVLCAGTIFCKMPALSQTSDDEHVPIGARCGIELWSIKTLRDPGARAIQSQIRSTTIDALAHQPAPADPDDRSGRIAPIETTVWSVRAQLVGYRLEDDGDYHLVLRDARTGAEMIAEIPAPYCVSSFGSRYAQLRWAVDALGRHPASNRFWWLDYHGATPPTVLISGVGFFDRLHEQAGVAANGVELHPVLGLSTVSPGE